MKRLWADYNLSIVLAILFLGCLIAQAILNFLEWRDEALTHGQPLEAAGYLVFFGGRAFENLQSEFLQLFSMVVLTSFLIHRGSHESKDQDEKVDQTLARIERRLERIEQAQGHPGSANGATPAERTPATAGSTARS